MKQMSLFIYLWPCSLKGFSVVFFFVILFDIFLRAFIFSFGFRTTYDVCGMSFYAKKKEKKTKKREEFSTITYLINGFRLWCKNRQRAAHHSPFYLFRQRLVCSSL